MKVQHVLCHYTKINQQGNFLLMNFCWLCIAFHIKTYCGNIFPKEEFYLASHVIADKRLFQELAESLCLFITKLGIHKDIADIVLQKNERCIVAHEQVVHHFAVV